MKGIFLFLLILIISIHNSFSQYYVRGEFLDEKNKLIGFVKMTSLSNNTLITSGNDGTFGISLTKFYDSFLISKTGFENAKVLLSSKEYNKIKLKSYTPKSNKIRQKASSITKELIKREKNNFFSGEETYSQYLENQWIETNRYPATGFGLHVNKASYSNFRRFINNDDKVPYNAVRIEELINYFNLNYTKPDSNQLFNFESNFTDCPWEPTDKLLMITLSAAKIKFEEMPPSQLVFLVDNSGSMDLPNRLPLLKSAFKMLVEHLRPIDKIAIVTYGGNVFTLLQPTFGNEKEIIWAAIEKMEPNGDTPGEEAIKVAYNLAEKNFITNGNNRIILATDGDFNVGKYKDEELAELVAKKRESGVYLTCLGVGMGNYKDSKLEILAKRGNGNFAYLDNLFEAEKTLVHELTQNLYSIAHDVKLNIKFNDELVSNYRLIGYDNKADIEIDSISEIDGGEIGSKNSLTAVFQIKTNSNIDSFKNKNIAYLNVDYKIDNNVNRKFFGYEVENKLINNYKLKKDLQIAQCLIMLGLTLKDSKYSKNIKWDQIISLAKNSINDEDIYQKELLMLLEKAKKIYKQKRAKY